MSTKIECEIYLALNDEGDWAVGTDQGDTVQALIDDYGCSGVIRTVKLMATMTAPVVEYATTDIPDTAGGTLPIAVEAA